MLSQFQTNEQNIFWEYFFFIIGMFEKQHVNHT